MKKLSIITLALAMAMAMPAMAVNYHFESPDTTDFYQSTAYEIVHGSQYNYSGTNLVDITDHTALLPGIVSQVAQPSASGGSTAPYTESTAGSYTVAAAYTPISGLLRSDGSIGTVSIPSLGINMKVYEGTTDQSMNKGLGHFSESSGWEGNVALSGHNRGTKYNIGGIGNMKAGDIIEYTTPLGTRQYAVTFVGQISATDWSYVVSKADNRITLITCVADQPSLRAVVQAAEVK